MIIPETIEVGKYQQAVIEENRVLLAGNPQDIAPHVFFNTPVKSASIEDVLSMMRVGVISHIHFDNLSRRFPCGLSELETVHMVGLVPPKYEPMFLKPPTRKFQDPRKFHLLVACQPLGNIPNEAVIRFKELTMADHVHRRSLRLLPPYCIIGGVRIKKPEFARASVSPIAVNTFYEDCLSNDYLAAIIAEIINAEKPSEISRHV